MTVVSPGSTSFFIIQVTQNGSVWGQATEPTLMNRGSWALPTGSWLLFNTVMGSWTLREGHCRHKLQSLDNLRPNALVRINVRETRTFTFKAFMPDYCK